VYTPVESHTEYITSHKRETIQLSLYLRGGKVYSSSDVVESKSEKDGEGVRCQAADSGGEL